MVQIFYSIAMILEIFGLETGLPTPADYPDWKREYDAARAQRAAEGAAGPVKGDFSLGSIIYNIMNPNWDWSAPWFEFTDSEN
jgi:hypothetical protein